MTPTMTHRPGRRRAALAALAVIAAVTSSGCAPPLSPGPSEVSVAKTTAQPTPTPGSGKLTRFDPQVGAAAEIVWGKTLTALWLPQASSVVAGLDGTSATEGSVYLTVPARYTPVAGLVSARNSADTFESYTLIEVPDPTATPPSTQATDAVSPAPSEAAGGVSSNVGTGETAEQAAGTVIEAERDGVRYTLTLTPDPGQEDLTLLLVRWETLPPA